MAGDTTTTQTQTTEREYISLSELNDFEESLGAHFDPEADANALLPPLNKGDYVVQVYHEGEDPTKFWEKKLSRDGQQVYLQSVIVAEVTDNPHNPPDVVGRKLKHRVTTLVMPTSGTTGAQALLQGIGKGETLVNLPRTHGHQARILSEQLNTKPITVMETDWEARRWDRDKNEETFRMIGMVNFPKGPDGKHVPMARAKDGDEIPARSRIRRWKQLSALAKSAPGGAADKKAVEDTPIAPPVAPITKADLSTSQPAAEAASVPQPAQPPAPVASTNKPEPVGVGGGKKK
jgi:hypothetical protein